MKAIVVERTGGPEVLTLKDVPDPSPQKGEVLVRLEAIGVNFIDVYHRTGLYKLPLPFTPGSEAAGVVESVGPEVTDIKLGDRVGYATSSGAYAQKAVVPAAKLIALPTFISTHDAAAILLQGMTAHYLVKGAYTIRAADWVLIHAAAGGVGQLLVRAAKFLGAHVIATVGSDEKARTVKGLGADEVIVYTKSDFLQETKRITNGAGVHCVYDSVGQSTFDRSLDCLRPRGMMVTFGQSSGAVPPFNPVLLSQKGSLFLTRPTLGHYVATREELMARSSELFDWVANGVVKITMDQTFQLTEAAAAHQRLESRQSMGKILLIP